MATIVFGLDGANWPLIEPWIQDGSLPTIRRLRREALWVVSESVPPPTTCPNWKCYASSRAPDTHDVYWWEVVDKETLEVTTPDARSFRSPELWDYLDAAGHRVGVMNLPMSYPPREVGEFLVAGGPPTEGDGYTYPAGLEAELEREDGYRVHPGTAVDGRTGQGVEETLDLIENRFATARRLFEAHDLDFLHLTIFYVNVLQHHFWNGDSVKRAWERIDDCIGEFLDEGHTIFLMSDHGCAEVETTFFINEWLEREGYLTLESSPTDYLMRFGLTQERVASLASTLGVKHVVDRLVPESVVRQFPGDEGFQHGGKFDRVDRKASVAVASGQGVLYVLVPPDSEEYTRVRESIAEGLRSLTTPAGRPVVSTVHYGEDVYPNGTPQTRPDIVFEQAAGVHTSGTVGYGQVMDEPDRWRAENVRDGLFLAHGDNVDASADLDRISILDIAPSVLYAMDEPVPRSFEGKPVLATNEQRDEPTYCEPLPDRTGDDGSADQAARERLSDLGYLD